MLNLTKSLELRFSDSILSDASWWQQNSSFWPILRLCLLEKSAWMQFTMWIWLLKIVNRCKWNTREMFQEHCLRYFAKFSIVEESLLVAWPQSQTYDWLQNVCGSNGFRTQLSTCDGLHTRIRTATHCCFRICCVPVDPVVSLFQLSKPTQVEIFH